MATVPSTIDYIAADGTVREDRLAGRKLLNSGQGGSRVERLYLLSGERVVWKATTDTSQAAREAGVYERVLPVLSAASGLLYPQLIAHGLADAGAEPSAETQRAWLVYEDVGELNHTVSEQALLELIGQMARWHALPTGDLALGPERGQLPDYVEQAADLLTELGWSWRGSAVPAERGKDAGASDEPLVFGVAESLVLRVVEAMKQEPPVIVYALCHGDLHAGNFGLVDGDANNSASTGRLRVVGWGHVHRNSPYWDLYHAIDMAHPLFPRYVGDAEQERLLTAYWEQAAEGLVPKKRESFLREYSLFSAVCSLWMLRQIEQELAAASGSWTKEQLLGQRDETRAAFRRCAGRV
ncbi:phosphotransferase [Paenibacillus curdlanolyticus]|nr:phosphotransferase [Paenibacillus curdlanolyticus]